MPTTDQSKLISAPIEAVWAKFSDFHDLSWASEIINSVEKIGDIPGSEVGAKRLLNGVFHETLLTIDHDNKTLVYSIDEGPAPLDAVSNYQAAVKLSSDPETGGTLVRWSSSWESDSEAAVEFCHNIYVALLEALAKSLE
jgi:hypothetical protein